MESEPIETSAVMTSFQAALETGDLDAIRRVPKSDLHNHFFLGGNRALVSEWAGEDIAPLDHKLGSMAEMHEWVQARFGALFAGAEGRLKAFEATLVQAKLDGVTRLETGETPWAITLHNGSATALTDACRGVHARVAPDIDWIPQLDLAREVPVDIQAHRLAPFLELGFWRSLDVSGDELAQSTAVFKPMYRKAKDAGLRLKAHVGEWGDADSVQRAVEELELDEVQHGIAAAQSSSVMRFLADNCICLNICPTSNVLLGRVESLAEHPIRKLYDAGVKVTVNTDDVMVFGQSVSDEFLNLYRAGLFNAAELNELRQNGLSDDAVHDQTILEDSD
jgi:adenosine deaminase